MLFIALFFAMRQGAVMSVFALTFGEVAENMNPNITPDEVYDSIQYICMMLFLACLTMIPCVYVFMSVF